MQWVYTGKSAVPLARASCIVHTVCPLNQQQGSGLSYRASGYVLRPSTRSCLVLHEKVVGEQELESALDFLQHGSGNAPTVTDGGIESEKDEVDFSFIYDDSADFDIPYDKLAEIEELEALRLANSGPSGAEKRQAAVAEAVGKWRTHERDVGSVEVQIAVANERVRYLTAHLANNRKDLSAKRGLQAHVVARRKGLEYLQRRDPAKARLLAEEMGIRFKSTGQEWDRHTKYGAFRNTKSKHAKEFVQP